MIPMNHFSIRIINFSPDISPQQEVILGTGSKDGRVRVYMRVSVLMSVLMSVMASLNMVLAFAPLPELVEHGVSCE